jgi:hypothetical protein
MNTKNYNEAIKEYFSLKEQYEQTKTIEKKSFLKTNKELSWREKRNLFKSMNYRCINCNRYVNTIFKINVKNNVNKHLIALCGDKSDPCPLNININLGLTLTYENGYNINQELVSDIKMDIIKSKNNLLFGYSSSSDGIETWDKLKTELASLIDISEYTKKALMNITNNIKKKEKIAELQQLYYKQIEMIKLYVEQYKASNNDSLIDDAVKLYVNELIVTSKELDMLLYSYRQVEYDNDENVYKLNEKQYSIEEMEYNLGDVEASQNDNVISFVTGLKSVPVINATATTMTKKKGRKTKAELAKEEKEIDELPDKFGPTKTVKKRTGITKAKTAKVATVKPTAKATAKPTKAKANKKVLFEIYEEEDEEGKGLEPITEPIKTFEFNPSLSKGGANEPEEQEQEEQEPKEQEPKEQDDDDYDDDYDEYNERKDPITIGSAVELDDLKIEEL